MIEQRVTDGRLGVKSGQGFYDDNEQRRADLTAQSPELARQLSTEPT